MSFLRSHRDRKGSLTSRGGSEATEASQPGQAPQHQQFLKSQQPFFFRSKSKRSDQGTVGMRKSLRGSSSSGTTPGPAPGNGVVVKRDGSLRDKARRASRSLKLKIKNLFSLSKSEDDQTGLPDQHIQSQKSHISSLFDSSHVPVAGPQARHSSNGSSLSRVPSNVASIHNVPSKQLIRSHRGSVESLKSEKEVSDEKSRVTSWTSSNTATIASQQQAWSEWERQRLSVIKENGAHCPSPSIRRPGVGTPPVRSQESFCQAHSPTQDLGAPKINSQRVYSALMKRLNETKQLAQMVEQQRLSSGEQSDPFRTMSPGSSSVCSSPDMREDATAATITIRRVPPSNENLPKPSRRGSKSQRQISRCEAAAAWEEYLENEGKPAEVRSRQRSSSASTGGSYVAYPKAAPGDGRGLSPGPLPRGDRSPPAGRALSDRSSAFFGSPTRHLFRTNSPFRRALQENMRASENASKETSRAESPFAYRRSGSSAQPACSSRARPGPSGILRKHLLVSYRR